MITEIYIPEQFNPSGIHIEEPTDRRPRLFNNATGITLNPGEKLQPVHVEITPEGCYAEDGRFKNPEDLIFRVIGFDRSNGREFWIGRGYVIHSVFINTMKGGVG